MQETLPATSVITNATDESIVLIVLVVIVVLLVAVKTVYVAHGGCGLEEKFNSTRLCVAVRGFVGSSKLSNEKVFDYVS